MKSDSVIRPRPLATTNAPPHPHLFPDSPTSRDMLLSFEIRPHLRLASATYTRGTRNLIPAKYPLQNYIASFIFL